MAARLFAYGDLELNVCRSREVFLIYVQTWRDVVELPLSAVRGDGHLPGRAQARGRRFRLGQSGLFVEAACCADLRQPGLITAIASGANFTFEIPEGEEPVLNVMGLPGDGHDCSARTAGQDH
ncbi:hypothetical protein AB0E78_36570 [Streptomyces sp. NPDC032198]|uniref:hypothetical protein n=1 Tax=Streptomyces sp. NPDC032198 TaxID=3155127 RepID=UPI0033C41C5D